MKDISRTCENCNRCCEGWLHGSVYGHNFYRGRFCNFLKNKSCSIYYDRPNFCKEFYCEWMTDETIPLYAKPSISNLIPVYYKLKNHKYLMLVSTDDPPDHKTLQFYLEKHYKKEIDNIVYCINNQFIVKGTDEFLKEANKLKQTIPILPS